MFETESLVATFILCKIRTRSKTLVCCFHPHYLLLRVIVNLEAKLLLLQITVLSNIMLYLLCHYQSLCSSIKEVSKWLLLTHKQICEIMFIGMYKHTMKFIPGSCALYFKVYWQVQNHILQYLSYI